MIYDVIVLGLGGMGAATAAALARRGVKVLGLEQFSFAHHRGSSHGRTRIIRTAYYEHPDYVPLVQRSFILWGELEQRTGKSLLTACPCLCVGEPDGELITGVQRAAEEHALPVERLTANEVEAHFPQFRLASRAVGMVEYSAGILAVEECVQAHIDDAIAHGAELRSDEPVMDWRAVGDGVEVRTEKGTYVAARLVVTTGAWATHQLTDLGVPLRIMRQVQWWFPSAGSGFRPDCFPVFLIDTPSGAFYGLPSVDEMGVKCARHYGAPELLSAEAVNWSVQPDEAEPICQFLTRHVPTLPAIPNHAEVCMYTLTPDRHFVIDRHPRFPQVVFACGFSGHGFKFAPAVGEVLADLALSGRTEPRLDLFRASRFLS